MKRIFISIGLFLAILSAQVLAEPSNNITSIGEGIQKSNYLERENNISSNYIKSDYDFILNPSTNKFISYNNKQNLLFTYNNSGFNALVNKPGSLKKETKISIKLNNVYKGSINKSFKGSHFLVNGNKAHIEDDLIRIDYLNNQRGMQQDFLIKKDLAKYNSNNKLKLLFSINSNQKTEINPNSVKIKDGNNKTLFSYDNLKVYDSEGTILDSKMESINKNEFAIAVNDKDAVYPITVDPLFTKEDWKALTGNPWEVGTSVADAGDVNGDGYDDVIVGAPGYWLNKGKVFVYYGSSTGLSAYPNWTAETSQDDSYFGASVDSAGDVNGDGYADIIVGARDYDDNHTDGGMVFVWYGSASGLGSPGTPANADWAVESSVDNSDFGISVASAGDVNGDGYDDVIIGDDFFNNTQGGQGKVFVYYGGSSGLSTSADWTSGVYDGERGLEFYGSSVSSAGDVNGDGYGDIIVGAKNYQTDLNNDPSLPPDLISGAAFVYYGGASGLSGSLMLKSEGQFGNSVSCAGDVNGDGYSDIIVGAYGYDPNNHTNDGAAFVYIGSNSGIVTTPNWQRTGYSLSSNYFGWSVSSAGDVDGDGYDDIIVGAPSYTNGESGEGIAYVFKGSSTGVLTNADWSDEPNISSADFGHSVSTAGDVDGDGKDDIIVGAPNINYQHGMAYAYYGGSTSYYPSGSGTQNDPYQISTLNDLYWIYKHSNKWGDYFEQTADIDATDTQNFDDGDGGTAEGFPPIGDHDYGNFADFTGIYNGHGYSIDNLTIKRSSVANNDNIGLFGYADNATFSNINLNSIDVEGNTNTGGLVGSVHNSIIENSDVSGDLLGNADACGGLAGYSYSTQITNCNSLVNVSGNGSYIGGLVGETVSYSTIDQGRSYGTITGLDSYSDRIGGLVGVNNSSQIKNSYSFSDVSNQHGYIGGLVGENMNSSTIINSYSVGSVSTTSYYETGGFTGYNYNSTISKSYSLGDVSGYASVGGFVGYNNSSASVDNCYSMGNVTRVSGSSSTGVGGFTGSNDGTISNGYSTGKVIYDGTTDPTDKGFVGDPGSGTYTDNYWDTDASLQSSTGGSSYATGESTTNMKNSSTFTNWDFSTPIWETNQDLNDGYPFLAWQHFENINITLQNISTTPMIEENLRIGFTAENSSADVTFDYKKTDPPNLPPNVSYIDKYWDIQSISGDNVKLRLYFSSSDISGFQGMPKIFHYDGSNWVELPTSGVMTSGSLSYVETTGYYSSFSPVTVGDGASPLPVELVSFTGTAGQDGVVLNWKTATEVNNYGYQVQRKKEDDQSESSWEDIGFVQGSGTSNSSHSYSFVDSDLPSTNKVDYRLKQIDNDGSSSYSKIIEVDISTITDVKDGMKYEFTLQQNYPNPFNPTTTIKYSIAKENKVMLKVYDILGEEVKTLVNKTEAPGNYEVEFNGSNLASGIYFYRLKSGKHISIKKLMLVK